MQNNFEEHIREKLLGSSETPSEQLWSFIEQELTGQIVFENDIRKKLEHETWEPVNPKIWNTLERKLLRKKKRKAFVWFFIVAAGVSASVLGLLNKTTENRPNKIVQQDFSIATMRNKTSNKALRKLSFASKTKNLVLEPPQTLKQAFTEKTNPFKKLTQAISFQAHANNEATVTPTTPEVPEKENINQAISAVKKTTKTLVSIQDTSSQIPMQETEKVVQAIDNLPKPIQLDSIASNKLFNARTYSKQTDKKIGNWSILVGYGINYTGMQLFGNQNQDNLVELATRKQIEKPFLDWNTTLLLEYKIGKKLRIASGFGISNFKQNINFNKETALAPVTHTQLPSSYLYNSDSIQNGNNYALKNSYTFNEIPLWLNYRIKETEKWHWDVLLGYSLGLIYTVNAYQVDPSGVGFLIVNNTESFPKFKTAHFVQLAPALGYKLNQRNELSLQVNCKAALNSIVSNSNWVQQRPYAIGLEIRYRRNF